MWAQTSELTGFQAVSADVSFEQTVVNAQDLTFVFGVHTNGTIDNGAGLLDDVSGSLNVTIPPCADQAGLQPDWVRIVIAEMHADAVGTSVFAAGDTGDPTWQTSICDRWPLSQDEIEYGQSSVSAVQCFADGDCDDDNLCTTETCDVGARTCVYDSVDCDDGSACTDDTCEPATGCVNTTITCDDENACTDDTCDVAAGCVFTLFDVPSVCDDSDACTDESCDPGSGCVNTTITCDDENACTDDTCDAFVGCIFMSFDVQARCDDGDACTDESCDTASGCVNTPVDPSVVCDDGDLVCTTDVCVSPTGCDNTPIDPAVVCDVRRRVHAGHL